MEEASYLPMVYFSPSKGYDELDLERLLDWPFWLAHYTQDWSATSFRYHFAMWQYTSSGTVDGIAAGDVMDLVYGTPCDASTGTTSSRDESAGGRSCVLARSATAMDAAHDDAMTGGTLITFALTPDEAISIINAQELGPIMAVTAQ